MCRECMDHTGGYLVQASICPSCSLQIAHMLFLMMYLSSIYPARSTASLFQFIIFRSYLSDIDIVIVVEFKPYPQCQHIIKIKKQVLLFRHETKLNIVFAFL